MNEVVEIMIGRGEGDVNTEDNPQAKQVGENSGKTVHTYESLSAESDENLNKIHEDTVKKYADELRKTGRFSEDEINQYLDEALKSTSREEMIKHTISLQGERNGANSNVKASSVENNDPKAALSDIPNSNAAGKENGGQNSVINKVDESPDLKEDLTDNDIQKMIEDKKTFSDEQLNNMDESQLYHVLRTLSFDYEGKISDIYDRVLSFKGSEDTEGMKSLVRDIQRVGAIENGQVEAMGTRNKRMAKNDNSPRPGNKISMEDHAKFVSDMKEINVMAEGFDTYCGDNEVLKHIHDGMKTMISDFPILKTKPLKIRYVDLQDTETFAMIKTDEPYTIRFNKRIFDDSNYLKAEYQKYADSGFFVQGTDYRSIIYHELGHILNKQYHELVESITRIIQKKAESNGIDVDSFIKSNISKYAKSKAFDFKNYNELLSEILSAWYNSNNEGIVQFVKEILKNSGFEVI